jgi:putative transposase
LDVKILCVIAKISHSGYYKWLKHSSKPERDCDDYLLIREIFDKGKRKYGFRTIQMKLLEKKIIMNHKKISRIMKKYNLIAKIRRTNPYKINREFNQSIPFKVLCADITYLPFNHRFAYLSVAKDIASGEVVGWNLTKHLEMDIVLGTIENMKNHTDLSSFKDVLIHSDQGFHYTNPQYIEKVKGLNMIQSMSRKGNCIDNAPIESFFGHLKDDVDYKSCKTFEEMNLLIEEYMKYYNNERPQWNLKKMTPVEYRNHLLAQV